MMMELDINGKLQNVVCILCSTFYTDKTRITFHINICLFVAILGEDEVCTCPGERKK